MPVVLIHGIGVREDSWKQIQQRCEPILRECLLQPLSLDSQETRWVYWGQFGASFAWDLACLPRMGILQSLGVEGDEGDTEVALENLLLRAAQRDLPAFVNQLVVQAILREDVEPETLIALYEAAHQHDLQQAVQNARSDEELRQILTGICAGLGQVRRRDADATYTTRVASASHQQAAPSAASASRRRTALSVASASRRRTAPSAASAPHQQAAPSVASASRRRTAPSVASASRRRTALSVASASRRRTALSVASASRRRTSKAKVSQLEAMGKIGVSSPLNALLNAALWATDYPVRLTRAAFQQLLRPKLTELSAQLMGDVMCYLTSRGERKTPGRILQSVQAALVTAPDEPLIVLTHSMGGNIFYDLLTYYRPDIQVDAWVSVAGQVGLLEELKLFKASNPAVRFPERVSVSPNIGYWVNVYDPVDVLGFAAEPIFDGVEDMLYKTGSGWAAHALENYFGAPRFYENIVPKLEVALRR